jgi:glutaredoxin
MEVVIYSKPGCHLCDVVKAQLERLRESIAFDLREVNILEDAASFEKFKEEIPVVFINGRKSFKYRLDERDFTRRAEAILNKERNRGNGA